MATLKEKIALTSATPGVATNPYSAFPIELDKVGVHAHTMTLNNLGDTSAPDPDPETPEIIPPSDYDIIAAAWVQQLASIDAAVAASTAGNDAHYLDFWNNPAKFENFKTIPGILKAATNINKEIAEKDHYENGGSEDWEAIDETSGTFTGLDYQVEGTRSFGPVALQDATDTAIQAIADIDAAIPGGVVDATVPADVVVFNTAIATLNTYRTRQAERINQDLPDGEEDIYIQAKAFLQAYGYVAQVEGNNDPDSAAITGALAGNYP